MTPLNRRPIIALALLLASAPAQQALACAECHGIQAFCPGGGGAWTRYSCRPSTRGYPNCEASNTYGQGSCDGSCFESGDNCREGKAGFASTTPNGELLAAWAPDALASARVTACRSLTYERPVRAGF